MPQLPEPRDSRGRFTRRKPRRRRGARRKARIRATGRRQATIKRAERFTSRFAYGAPSERQEIDPGETVIGQKGFGGGGLDISPDVFEQADSYKGNRDMSRFRRRLLNLSGLVFGIAAGRAVSIGIEAAPLSPFDQALFNTIMASVGGATAFIAGEEYPLVAGMGVGLGIAGAVGSATKLGDIIEDFYRDVLEPVLGPIQTAIELTGDIAEAAVYVPYESIRALGFYAEQIAYRMGQWIETMRPSLIPAHPGTGMFRIGRTILPLR